jgi:glycosyltransferase involved in cell wall biosynthesis
MNKSQMKIVFVNPVGVIGGGEKAILTCMMILLEQCQDKVDLHLIVGTEGPIIEQAQQLGVQVKLLKSPEEFNKLGDSAFKGKNPIIASLILLISLLQILPSFINYIKEFYQALKKIKPDLIHSNGIKAHLLTAWSKPSEIPLIWHIQDFYGSRPLMAKLLKWSSNHAQLGIAISQALAQDMKSTLGNLPIKVIYSAVDVNYFSPQDSPSHSPLRVGLVATFARWKGQDIFLEAIAQLTQKYPDFNAAFYIVGGAIYKTQGSQFSQQELEEQASNLGISDKVNFLGFQRNIVEIYHWLDIVVHASTQPEPFGLAIVEAMACGKAVIVSQAGGASELFTQNEDAIGVPPGDSSALANAIADLVNQPEKRQSLSEKARQTAVQRFNHQRLGQQLIDIYQTVIAANKR